MSRTPGSRPSDARRELLRRDEKPPPILSNFFPIERYYGIADKVLKEFDMQYASDELDHAFVYGRRFAMLSTQSLPRHDYYNSPNPQSAAMRIQNQRECQRVMDLLEDVVNRMDEEELVLQTFRQRQEVAERKRLEALLKKQREELIAYNKHKGKQKTDELEKTALLKLATLSAPSGFDGVPRQNKIDEEKHLLMKSSFDFLDSIDNNTQSLYELPPKMDFLDANISSSSLPFPIPPPVSHDPPSYLESAVPSAPLLPPPPSYSHIMQRQHARNTPNLPSYSDVTNSTMRDSNIMPMASHDNSSSSLSQLISSDRRMLPTTSLEDASLDVQLHRDLSSKQIQKPAREVIPIRSLRKMYTDDYDEAAQKKQVQIFKLDTYQGRLKAPGKDSTNGCTVISPLVAAHHLACQGSGIADMTIEDVIDNQAPPILSHVRSKLGLPADALIIPSDVHDYLVDRKILHQEKFVGACGGNILDPVHIGEFLKMLEGEGDNAPKKLASALFFHEHVVSILKIVGNKSGAWFDIVDSMPRDGKATRIRCKTRVALEVTLRWYASAKFSDPDCQYIDGNEWDDIMCDFDPRVFQAFVWVE